MLADSRWEALIARDNQQESAFCITANGRLRGSSASDGPRIPDRRDRWFLGVDPPGGHCLLLGSP